jgi:Asp-tRNA(Asn)/Glu-tRNA(Gln) amidotransferase A subunit family amidase
MSALSARAGAPFSKVISGAEASRHGPHLEIASQQLADLAEGIRKRELSSREVVQAFIDRIDALNDAEVNAFIYLDQERALEDADQLDRALARGEIAGTFHGVPLSIKDVIDVAGMPTTGGTQFLKKHIPHTDAAVVRALKSAGAVILGKTNLHELSFGTTSANPHFGSVRNPYDQTRVAGGSSGGAAAAVAARLCPGALGTDTGGSARIPASLCGTVGLKPSIGRTSQRGIMGLSWTCDVVGPITQTVTDAARIFDVISQAAADRAPGGLDYELPRSEARARAADASIFPRTRIGVLGGYFAADNDPEVDAAISNVATILSDNGAAVSDIELPGAELMVPTAASIVLPEAFISLQQYWSKVEPPVTAESVLNELGDDVRQVLAGEAGNGGEQIPARAYLEALQIGRRRIRETLNDAFQAVDMLLSPTVPAPAAELANPAEMLLNGQTVGTFETYVRYTFGFSAAGLPAVTVPAGQTEGGLPIGVQLIGKPWRDEDLIELAAAFELVATA